MADKLASLCALSVLLCGSRAGAAERLGDAELDRRIEALRKGDFVVSVRDALGRPVTNEVRFTLSRHEFPFGTAVSARLLLADPAADSDARHYQGTLATYFNCAVAENAHKWYAMESQPGALHDEEALAVWEKCRAMGLAMRGHCVLWGAATNVQPWVKELAPVELEKAVRARMIHVLRVFDGKITEWDLNNEMLRGDFYAERLGWKNGARYFKWARSISRGNSYYVNDYGSFERDAADRYCAHIRELLRGGAAVGGIGEQAHFSSNGVPPTHEIWATLDKLGQFGLPVKITEFDIQTGDEARQAADTRRFYRACFAHPAVHGILMWGFWEGAHWRPEAALWRRDWTIKPNGVAYKGLMEEWRTRGAAVPDAKGRIRFRGFFGDYTLRCGAGTGRVSLNRDGKRKATATLRAGEK